MFVVVVFLVAIFVALAALGGGAFGPDARRDRVTERALAQAHEALLAYAAERPIDAVVGPGYLPCPDTDDDGWAESTCGSMSGHLGQAARLGRLPWKTLGLPDLRDGWGERLWYAVSTRHKGLLNCAASRECRDMSPPAALGTITVRDPSGRVLHDGTLADPSRADEGGAAAVVLAPGPPIRRADGREQRRDCGAGDCADPANYLDLAPARAGGEDNASFVDRTDARAGNADGFIAGPVAGESGVAVNDRLAAVTYAQVMPRVLSRVALELASCVATSPATAEPACGPVAAGRIADEHLSGASCNARATDPAWWTSWREHVLLAPAAPDGIDVLDADGRLIASRRRFALIAAQRAGECASDTLACDAWGCSVVMVRPRTPGHHEALVSR